MTGNDNTKEKLIRQPMPYGKVLIVDDVDINIEITKVLLLPYKLNVDEALSGFEAIAKLEHGENYDLIFMDHLMPKMDGLETTIKIREMGYTVPIIALTANPVAGQEELFRENGFDGYMLKPVDIRQLDEILNKFIRDIHI